MYYPLYYYPVISITDTSYKKIQHKYLFIIINNTNSEINEEIQNIHNIIHNDSHLSNTSVIVWSRTYFGGVLKWH